MPQAVCLEWPAAGPLLFEEVSMASRKTCAAGRLVNLMKGYIKKRGKDSWTLIFDLGPDPKTGRRRQKWETIRDCSKREAQRILNSRLTDVEDGNYVAPSDILVEEFLSRWLDAWAK